MAEQKQKRKQQALSAVFVKDVKEPGYYFDYNPREPSGLYLQVTPGTVGVGKSWVFRYILNSKAREMGLGSFKTTSLARARELATAARKLVLDGVDPIERRKQDRAPVRTFQSCAEEYIAANKAGWKNAKHATQWTNTLTTYAYPLIGDMPVNAIGVKEVLSVIRPLWGSKTETASRLRSRIELILAAATVHGYRQGPNPAVWRNNLSEVLPKRNKVQKPVPHGAVDWKETPAFVAKLRAVPGVSPRALEFTILTACRVNEVVRAEWSEFDLDGAVWRIPASRMKGQREHRVPLSPRAIAILKDMQPFSDTLAFPSPVKDGSPLTDAALLELVRQHAGQGKTTHGFRSAFRDWAAEATNYPNEVAEMALAHSIKDKTEAAYRRGDLMQKRHRMMVDWAAYLAKPVQPGKVVPMRGRKSA